MQSPESVRLAEPFFEDDEIETVVAVLKSGMLVQGKQVAAFEAKVGEYLGVREAIACANGTASLHLAFLALDLAPGDEVIVPDFAFPAAANMVEQLDGRAVPVDIELSTFNINPALVAGAITERTRAIMPVHLFGLMTDLRPLVALGESRGIPVVEDAACALGATRPGAVGHEGVSAERVRVGHETAMACISFHPRKVITTGEGGMVVTNDTALAERLRRLRNHGAHSENGQMTFRQLGFNYRMTEVQGALGIGQMKRLEEGIARRRAIAALYDDLLTSLPLMRPSTPAGFEHVYQSYVVVLSEEFNRDAVVEGLKRLGVESTLGTYSLTTQPYYCQKYGLDSESCPQSRIAYTQSLALPIHPRMTEQNVVRVVEALSRVLGELSS